MLIVTEEQRAMLVEAGFETCWVRDIDEGDTISIEHEAYRDRLTEMKVTELWQYDTVKKWIGVLTDGRKVHCSYGIGYGCWKQTSHHYE
jgi:hypothetical protein